MLAEPRGHKGEEVTRLEVFKRMPVSRRSPVKVRP